MTLLLLLTIVFVPMLVETARAARNERAQFARGGIEPPDDVYKMMRVAYPSAFLAMIAEVALRGLPPRAALWAGAGLFAAAKALKWWAMSALGQAWTFRVVVVPGMPIVAHGPYRFLRHPNYVAVVGELASVALAAGARITGPLAVVGFGLLIARRIAVERRALRAVEGAILRRE